jgi:hypothetical protein
MTTEILLVNSPTRCCSSSRAPATRNTVWRRICDANGAEEVMMSAQGCTAWGAARRFTHKMQRRRPCSLWCTMPINPQRPCERAACLPHCDFFQKSSDALLLLRLVLARQFSVGGKHGGAPISTKLQYKIEIVCRKNDEKIRK